MAGPLSRVLQAHAFIFGKLKPPELDWIAERLDPLQQLAFSEMHRADQLHGFQVAKDLEKRSAPLEVLQAALLHDAGKPASFGLLKRTLAILCPKYFPDIRSIKREHPAIGAEKLSGILPENALLLVRDHHDPLAKHPWLAELQEADSLH